MTDWVVKFAGHQWTSFVTVCLIVAIGIIVNVHLILGHDLPSGYEPYFLFVLALSGVNVAGMTLRRSTDYDALRIKSGQPTTATSAPDAAITNAPVAPAGAP